MEAMNQQYQQCLYWEKQALQMGGRKMARRTRAVEAVRAQIAPYYMHRLMEQGCEPAVALKIVGTAIHGFDEGAELHQKETVNVSPNKLPSWGADIMIEKMESHAIKQLKLVRQSLGGSCVTHGR